METNKRKPQECHFDTRRPDMSAQSLAPFGQRCVVSVCFSLCQNGFITKTIGPPISSFCGYQQEGDHIIFQTVEVCLVFLLSCHQKKIQLLNPSRQLILLNHWTLFKTISSRGIHFGGYSTKLNRNSFDQRIYMPTYKSCLYTFPFFLSLCPFLKKP